MADGVLRPATQHTQINSLDPGQTPPQNAAIRAVVSLIWPYSSATRTAAFLLADPDFRRRRNGGQVRVQLHGAAAREVASSKIGIGDDVELNLEGASWAEASPHARTPGQCVAGELLFRKGLQMSIERNGNAFASIDLNEPPSPAPENVHTPIRAPPATASRSASNVAQRIEHKTPIRLSLDAHTSPLDPSMDDGYELDERPRKRQRTSGLWRYERTSPIPTPAISSVGPTAPEEPSETSLEARSARSDEGTATRLGLRRIETENAVPPMASVKSTLRPQTPPSPHLKPLESAILPLISPLAAFGQARESQPDVGTATSNLSSVHGDTLQNHPQLVPYPRSSPITQAIAPQDEDDDQGQTVEEHDPPDFGLDGATMSRSSRHSEAAPSPAPEPLHPDTPECDERPMVQDTYQSQADISLVDSQPFTMADESDAMLHHSPSGDRRSGKPDTMRELSPEKPPLSEWNLDTDTPHGSPVPSSSPLPVLERTPTPPTQFRPVHQSQSSRSVIEVGDTDEHKRMTPITPRHVVDGGSAQPTISQASGTSPNPAHPSNLFGSQLSASNGLFASSQISNRTDWTDKTYVPNSESEGTDLEHPSTRAATPGSDHLRSGSATPQAAVTMADDVMRTPTATWHPNSSPKLPSSAFSPFTPPTRERGTGGHRDDLLSDSEGFASTRHPTDTIANYAENASTHGTMSPQRLSAYFGLESSEGMQSQLTGVEDRVTTSLVGDQAYQSDMSKADAQVASLATPPDAGHVEVGTAVDGLVSETSQDAESEVKENGKGLDVSQIVPQHYANPPRQPYKAEANRAYTHDSSTSLERRPAERANELTPEASQTDPAQSAIQYPTLSHHRVDQILDGRMPPTPAPSAIPAAMVDQLVESSTLPQKEKDATNNRDDRRHTSAAEHSEETRLSQETPITEAQPTETAMRKRISEVPEAISTWFSSGSKPSRAKARLSTKPRSSQPRSSLGPTAKIRAPSAGFTFGTAATAMGAGVDQLPSTIEPRDTPSAPTEGSTNQMVLPASLTKAPVEQVSEQQPQQVEGIRTGTSYYTPLSRLGGLLNRATQNPEATVDVIAIVSSPSSNPQRAKSGPKDYNTLLHIMDSSSPTAEVQVQIFRPFKLSLPIAETGDVVLLRHFQVKSRLRKPFLLSGEGSAWHVWRYSRHEMQEDCRGPPVEIGDGEQEQAKKLRAWWVSIMNDDDEQNEKHAPEDTNGEGNVRSIDGHTMNGGALQPAATVPLVN